MGVWGVAIPEWPKSLRFEDPGVEGGFVASQHAKLKKQVCFLLCPLAFWILAVYVLFLTSGWSTGGGRFVDSAKGARLASMRNWVLGGVLAVCVVVAGCTRSSRCMAFLGPRGFEVAVTVAIGICGVSVPLQHPWYLASIFGVSDPWALVVGDPCVDDNMLLLVHVYSSLSHFVLPIRWVVFWPIEVLVVLCYIIPALAWASDLSFGRVALNFLMLGLLVVLDAIGKRERERNERQAFVQIAAERTMRVQAEHKLYISEKDTGSNKQQAADTKSVFTTTTSELFDLRRHQDRQAQLTKLCDLGTDEHWLVKKESLKPVHDKVLGMGGFGVVVLALYHGAEVVVKAALTKNGADVSLTAADELRTLRRLKHPNIVGFYGACVDPESCEIVLVLEYVRGVDLNRAILGICRTASAVVERCMIVEDICCALKYLHNQEPTIIHGDIKAANVRVHLSGMRRRAKLLDFGLSRVLTRKVRQLGGTVRWMAPEVIRGEQAAKAPSSDVFSFGRLVYMIMTGRVPLLNLNKDRIIEAAHRRASIPLDWPTAMPLLAKTRALCEMCLEADPGARASIAEAQAMMHSWPWEHRSEPDEVMFQLGKALPRPEPSTAWDLNQALSTARAFALNGGAMPVVEECPIPGMERQAQQESTHAPLLMPHFMETPAMSKLKSMVLLSMLWNIRVPDGSCCTRHAMCKELLGLAELLQAPTKCGPVDHIGEWQCPSCGVMAPHEPTDGCEWCSWEPPEGSAPPESSVKSVSRAKVKLRCENASEVADEVCLDDDADSYPRKVCL
mmetsp:Transcript_48057/g.155067  ORF Transcript_48057/g.155067 Transcript_48057/m.155067 type:complete len:787 (+) Transcript_48057:148-2508(+)